VCALSNSAVVDDLIHPEGYFSSVDPVSRKTLYWQRHANRVTGNRMFAIIFTARRVCIARTMSWQDVCLSVRPPSVTRRYCV